MFERGRWSCLLSARKSFDCHHWPTHYLRDFCASDLPDHRPWVSRGQMSQWLRSMEGQALGEELPSHLVGALQMTGSALGASSNRSSQRLWEEAELNGKLPRQDSDWQRPHNSWRGQKSPEPLYLMEERRSCMWV